MTTQDQAIRPPTLRAFTTVAASADPLQRWTARGQNFAVHWAHANTDGQDFALASPDELMVLVLGAAVQANSERESASLPPRSVCILPGGCSWRFAPAAGATLAVIVSLREDVAECGAVNEADYAPRDARIRPVGAPYQAVRDGDRVRITLIDHIQAPPEKARLKMLQTSTLSINWVEYDGPRDRAALSPHAHSDFEQGSLALAGEFVHHLRAPWGENADLWQEDRHAHLPSPSLMVVPVNLIHTSEGVGPGKHLLIDVFSPPRADFIAKGWMLNAGDYRAPDAG